MLTNRIRAGPRGLQTLFHAGSLIGVTDGQLLERFALRDGEASEAAFAALVERHTTLVWRTCRAVLRDEHEAADAFQATFLVLVRKAGSLWVRDSIAPWLHRVAFRAANQAGREVKRRHEAERRAAELNAGWTQSAMPDDLAEVMHEEIDRLLLDGTARRPAWRNDRSTYTTPAWAPASLQRFSATATGPPGSWRPLPVSMASQVANANSPRNC